MNRYASVLGLINGPHAVYSDGTNNYLIYSMAGNVSEIVMNEKEYCVMGGSWKNDGPDYSATYKGTTQDSIKYNFPQAFKPCIAKDDFVSSAIGFRVAMTLVGAYNGKLPYKRRKGSK